MEKYVSQKAYKYKINRVELHNALQAVSSKKALLFSMSGKMGAGKDTIGDAIAGKLVNLGYDVINTSFGELIRGEIEQLLSLYKSQVVLTEIAKEMNTDISVVEKMIELMRGCTVYDRTDNVRAALQLWGTDVRRENDKDYWVNKMSRFIVSSINNGYSVNVTDARFPNEVELIEDLLGKVVRLDVPQDVRRERIERRDNVEVNPSKFYHKSETVLDDYNFKFTLDGTRKIEELIDEGFKYIIR